MVILIILSAIILERRHRRARLTRHTPLMFEDALPTEIEPLRLNAYEPGLAIGKHRRDRRDR